MPLTSTRPTASLRFFSPSLVIVLVLLLAAAMLLGSAIVPAWAAKRKTRPVVQPELRITSVVMTPEDYVAGGGALEFVIEVELPKDTEATVLLEVSSLISSPSKRSMRFLSSRQPVEDALGITAASVSDSSNRRVEVTLSWDGLDQAKELVTSGTYHYEIRAKLLSVGESGPRTQMVSWPKRGMVVVR